jgi:hypothetical protein
VIDGVPETLDMLRAMVRPLPGAAWPAAGPCSGGPVFASGGAARPGARESRGVLNPRAAPRAQGKKVVFVTNNSTKSRAGYLGKFTSLGLNVAAEEIYSSSYAAAAYLESINFPKTKKARPRAARGAPNARAAGPRAAAT